MKYRKLKGCNEYLKKKTDELEDDMSKMWMVMSPVRAENLPSPFYMPIKHEEN
jgi:hypothetical protein